MLSLLPLLFPFIAWGQPGKVESPAAFELRCPVPEMVQYVIVAPCVALAPASLPIFIAAHPAPSIVTLLII